MSSSQTTTIALDHVHQSAIFAPSHAYYSGPHPLLLTTPLPPCPTDPGSLHKGSARKALTPPVPHLPVGFSNQRKSQKAAWIFKKVPGALGEQQALGQSVYQTTALGFLGSHSLVHAPTHAGSHSPLHLQMFTLTSALKHVFSHTCSHSSVPLLAHTDLGLCTSAYTHTHTHSHLHSPALIAHREAVQSLHFRSAFIPVA